MNIKYTSRNGRITFEGVAKDPKDLFRVTSLLQRNFEPDEVCGLCKSAELQYSVRDYESEFFALRCNDCGARLAFSQKKDGTLFARRQDMNGKYMPNRGWVAKGADVDFGKKAQASGSFKFDGSDLTEAADAAEEDRNTRRW